jgi:hypothetical protein
MIRKYSSIPNYPLDQQPTHFQSSIPHSRPNHNYNHNCQPLTPASSAQTSPIYLHIQLTVSHHFG